MKRHLTALAALTLLALPVTGCAKSTHTHHHTDAVPVCSHVRHSLGGDYVQGGHRPCVLQSPTVYHHPSPRTTGTSAITPGVHPATTTGRTAATSAPRFSKTPAPKPSKAAPPAPAKKVAPPAAPKAPSLTKSKPSR